jgi:aminoglycoside phosphotransferase family enzyme/predicted kinase
MNDSAELASARARVEALQAALWAQEGEPVRLVETHISWVLLARTKAYKFKKPVHLPFLDFMTLEARRHCCEEELRLNARLAPSVYLGLAEVRQGPQGPSFGAGSGPVLDVAVHMRRFPDGALWREMAAQGALTAQHVDEMANRLADFHRSAAIAPPQGVFGSSRVRKLVTRRLVQGLDESAPADAGWPAIRSWLLSTQQALESQADRRLKAGQVRECHGDLHLGNVLQLDGAPAAFDGIEFNESMRWIDTLDDAAFLAMDLMAHGLSGLAWRFVNAYLDATGDHDGLPLLRFYLVSRALVRAEVAALTSPEARSGEPGRHQYLALARGLIGSAGGRLAITHGLPGSGKSWVSLALCEAAGAIRVRSDVERKRLFGLAPLAQSRDAVPEGIYGADTTQRTYARLQAIARTGLAAGWPMVIDAAFLRADERAVFAALAREAGLPFRIIDCRAALPVLQQRVEQRDRAGRDPSEADLAVLERLHTQQEPLTDSEARTALVAQTDRPLDVAELARCWLAAVPAP